MDSHRFDTLTKQLSLLKSRREGRRALLAGLITGSLGLPLNDDAPDVAGPGVAEAKKKRRKKSRKHRGKRQNKRPPEPPCGVKCRRVTESCVPADPDRGPCCAPMCCTPEEECCGCPDVESCVDHVKPACAALFPGLRCCRNTDVVCTGDCDCCGTDLCALTPCGGGETLCCRPEGADCGDRCQCCGETAKCVDGKCDSACSELGEACAVDGNCCRAGHVCAAPTPKEGCPPAPEKVCCADIDQPCASDCNCCGDTPCVNGTCGCTFIGDPCGRDEECCGFPAQVCLRNSLCDQQGVCCSGFGGICDPQSPHNGDCDCCFPLKCQDDQTCRCIFNNQDIPCDSTRDCCFGNVCFDQRCCVPPGGSCVQIEKCCDGHVCRFEAGRNVGECVAPACPDPGQRQRRRDGDGVAAEGIASVPCQVGDLVVCCQEEGDCCTRGPEPDCCEADEECTAQGCVGSICAPGEVVCQQPPDFQPCCPAGATCSQVGCLTDEPRACPAGADTCARPLVFCSEKNNRLNCSCNLDIDGNSFCNSGITCGRECSNHAECDEPERGIVGSRCVRCESTCGHDRGVCASPCFDGL